MSLGKNLSAPTKPSSSDIKILHDEVTQKSSPKEMILSIAKPKNASKENNMDHCVMEMVKEEENIMDDCLMETVKVEQNMDDCLMEPVKEEQNMDDCLMEIVKEEENIINNCLMETVKEEKNSDTEVEYNEMNALGENNEQFLNCESEEVNEELHSSEDDETNPNSRKHACEKCNKSFRLLKSFKEHLDYCRFDSSYHLRKAEMLKNLEKIEKDAINMESKDICFCCGESYDTFHRGHIKCADCPKLFKTQISYERHVFITHSECDDHPCSICNAKMRSANLLQLHEEQHRKRGKPFCCKICGKEFASSHNFSHHKKYSSCSETGNGLRCMVCNKSFFHPQTLKVHLKKHLGIRQKKKWKYNCHVCQKLFYRLDTLNIHIRTHTGEKPFNCDLCDKKFRTMTTLKTHRNYHTGEKPYSCSVCKKSFGSPDALGLHMKYHTGDRRFSCSYCGKTFVQGSHLRTHMKIHQTPYECDQCPEKFGTETQLMKHVKEQHIPNISTDKPIISQPFDCNVCGKKFTSLRLLELHRRYHKGEKRYTCSVCKRSFVRQDVLALHMRCHTGERPYSCTECGKSFTQSSTLRTHIKIHLRPYECDQCPEKFRSENRLKEHMKEHDITNMGMDKHLKPKSFNCDLCEKKFLSSRLLEIHTRNHTGEKPYTCSVCNKSFAKQDVLRRHMRSHTGEKPYSCTECGKSFLHGHSLRTHIKIHISPYECDKCPEKFRTANQLKKHLKEQHVPNMSIDKPIISKPFDCHLCEKQFPTLRLLEIHTRNHTGEKPYTCSVCNKSFAKKDVLRRHMRSHTGEKSYSCTECGKSFIQGYSLRKHMKIHLKPYECDQCPEKFRSENQLTKHMKEHKINMRKEKRLKPKSFNCDLCEKKFPTSRLLEIHRRYHTGEKPYTCFVCKKSFARQDVLGRHMKRHTGDRPYSCDECGKSFIQSYSLRKHIKVHLTDECLEKPQIENQLQKYTPEQECNKSTLTMKMSYHLTPKRYFNCDLCGKKFKFLTTLKIHRGFHTKEKPYTCSVCKKAFTRQYVLKRHMRCHTGERPYSCTECGKCFMQGVHLRVHFHTHLKPYECRQCPEKFRNEKQLNKHTREHKKLEMNTSASICRLKTRTDCAVCHLEFDSVQSLQFHIHNVHQEDSEKFVNEDPFEKADDAFLVLTPKVINIEDAQGQRIECVDSDSESKILNTNVQSLNSQEYLSADERCEESNKNRILEQYTIDNGPSTSSGTTDVTGKQTIFLSNEIFTITPLESDGDLTDPITTSFSNDISVEHKKLQRKSLAESFAAALADDDENGLENSSNKLQYSVEDEKIKDNVKKLLDMLVDSCTLKKFGWPDISEETVLYEVIENYGHDLSKDEYDYAACDYASRMRKYVKLLFTIVINDDFIKELVNNNPIDEVIEYVLGNFGEDNDFITAIIK